MILPAQPIISWKANRASRILSKAFSAAGERLGEVRGSTLFTYWDTYGGNPLDLSEGIGNGAEYDRVLQLVERRITNPLANKRTLARSLVAAELSHWAPPTYESVADVLRQPGWREAVWFVKSVFGTGGEGMFCVAGNDLETLTLRDNQIIQQGIENIELIDGRKFTVRIYIFIWNHAVYLYGDGFAVIHGVPYIHGSTDYAVQIDHRGYEKNHGAITLLPLHQYKDWAAVFPEMKECIAALMPLLKPVIDASCETSYAVLGLDFLLLDDNGVRLIEINNMPNFIHNQEINEKVNVPFWRAVIETLLRSSDSDSGFCRIGATHGV